MRTTYSNIGVHCGLPVSKDIVQKILIVKLFESSLQFLHRNYVIKSHQEGDDGSSK